MDSLTLTPIGFMRTAMHAKFDAPHQPSLRIGEEGVIELLPGHHFEDALDSLSGFDRVWIVWWFHKNKNWRPRVLPPRGRSIRRGVFATRSPHRPNPIGITVLPLLKVTGRTIYVGKSDLVDGTPILDIKPYIPEIDAFPNAKAGWVDELAQECAGPLQFSVTLSSTAQTQCNWLKSEWQVDFMPRVQEILGRDPLPHRTRRIVRTRDNRLRLSCGGWRVFFSIEGSTVTIENLACGYPDRLLIADSYEDIPDKSAQIAFGKIWP
jgi:tRNA-Thr(GGU) m(6)t(6)A37 methyltransferase TsaA